MISRDAGLRLLDKPVEFWLLPNGQHNVFKIRERLLTYELLVDWFDFWLNGREDTDLVKAEQYARWRRLHEQQNAALKQPRPPLLEWTATPVPGTGEGGAEQD